MFGKLGVLGVLGILVMLGGIGVVALENLYIAAGIALVVAGLGLTVFGILRSLLASLGMGGMV